MSNNRVEFAVVQILNNNAVLIEELMGRITPLARDSGGKLPAIVYAGSAPSRERYLDNTFSDIATVEMAFEVWAANYMQAKKIVSTAISELNSFSGNIAGISVLTISCEPGSEAGSWDGNELVVEFSALVTAKWI